MKKTYLALISLLIGSFCCAQEITKDGYGPLHWGMSVTEAEKLVHDFGKLKPDLDGWRPEGGVAVQGKGWRVDNGIPADVKLLQMKDHNSVQCSFYDGKLIAVFASVESKAMPTEILDGIFTDTFQNDLKQRIVKGLGNTDELNVDIRITKGGRNGYPVSQTYITTVIRLSNKKLLQAALEDSEKRLSAYVVKVKEQLLTSIPSDAVKP